MQDAAWDPETSLPSSWLRKDICRQAKAQKLRCKISRLLIKMDRGEPKARGGGYVSDCIVYEDRSIDVQPTSTNEELENFRIGLDKSNISRKHKFVKGRKKGKELAGNVEFVSIVVAQSMDGHTCLLQSVEDGHAAGNGPAERLHPSDVESTDEFGVTREALNQELERCRKVSPGIEYSMIDLQQPNLRQDRGCFRIQISHSPVEVAWVPAHEDVADIENDAIDPVHACKPRFSATMPGCRRRPSDAFRVRSHAAKRPNAC